MAAVRKSYGSPTKVLTLTHDPIVRHYRRIAILYFLILSVLLCYRLSLAEETVAEERVVPELRATRINPATPVIDGILDDKMWNKPGVESATEFTQREPDEGQALTESTKVAVVYDDNALYVAFWCYDSEPEKTDRQLVRRDRHSESDLVVVRLDPYHDHQTGFQFYLSAAGVQLDTRIYNDDYTDYDWDGVWDGAVKMQPWGWTAEYRIPYHCLRFTKQEEHIWGIDFARRINRKTESGRWAFTPQSEGGFASNFGHLTGLTGIKPSRHVEILPYIVSSAELESKHPGNPDGRRALGNMGFDVKYALTSNLILDAAINPDFGQVELDQPVLNLSAFETFYPEKRPFFLEGANLFRTNYQLFYSRRIGRSPSLGIDDDDWKDGIDRPAASTILGATKLTGKLSGGTSLAFLSAVTQEEKAKYLTTSHQIREAMVEPTANYSVLRVKQDVLSRSSVGGMLTFVGQDTRHPATTGGADWRLYTNNGVWATSGQVVFSRNDGENVGFGVSAQIEKAAGKHIRGAIGFENKDPYLNLNRLGYLGRNDWREGWLWVQYRTQDDWWIVRNSWNNVNLFAGWNYAGYNIMQGWNVNSQVEFVNNWTLGGGLSMQGEKYSDLETRGNGIWEWPVYPTFAWWASLNTDQRKRISFNINPGSGSDRGGSWWANYIGVEYRPRSNMEFSTGANYHRTFGGTRWVENRDDQAIFADLDQDQVFFHLTASIMPHRNLSWQISGEGYITSLEYRNHRGYLGGRDYRGVEPGEYDANFSALNSSMIVRWEYLPGSTLYFVWTRSRSEYDQSVNDLTLKRDFDRLFSHGADNIWLLKASYWWNI